MKNKKFPKEYFTDRQEFLNEMKLRKCINDYVDVILNEEVEEQKLRKVIQVIIENVSKKGVLKEAKTETTPHNSTAINFLEDLLKKILPTIEQDYKSLTTRKEQRDSFRAHLISNVESGLETTQLNMQGAVLNPEEELYEEEKIQIDVVDDDEGEITDEKFIDIEEPEEEDVEEAEDTGAKLASQTYDGIETQTNETFATLSDEEDQETFIDYLITNLKLYFDKWEKELGDVVEPTTDEYEEEVEENETDMEIERGIDEV